MPNNLAFLWIMEQLLINNLEAKHFEYIGSLLLSYCTIQSIYVTINWQGTLEDLFLKYINLIFIAYLTVETLLSYFEFLFLSNYCVLCLRINSKPRFITRNCHIFLKQSNFSLKFWILLDSHCFTLPPTLWHSLWDFIDCSYIYIYIYMYTHSIAVSWQISFPLSYCCFLADSFFLSFMFLLLFHGGLLFTYH